MQQLFTNQRQLSTLLYVIAGYIGIIERRESPPEIDLEENDMKTKVATALELRRTFLKRYALAGLVLAVLVVVGSRLVMAEFDPRSVFGGAPPGMDMKPGNFEDRMAKLLKLTDAQQSAIKDVFDSEREQMKPLFDKMHEFRKQLMQAEEAPVFNEADARAIAIAQAQAEAELIVSRTITHRKINALLTPEQRELDKKLRQDMNGRPQLPDK